MIDLYDSELFVHYGFFSLRSPDAVVGDLGEARAGQANGLCGANLPGQVWCTTGLHTGDIPLRVEWLPASPPTPARPVLRPLERSDIPALAELTRANRDFLAPTSPPRPEDHFTDEGQERAVLQSLQAAENGTALPMVIVDEGGKLVGTLNINSIIRGAFQSASIGYWVAQDRNGEGFASAAVAAAKRVAQDQLGLHRLQAETLLDNAASQRVLVKNGFIQYGQAPNYLKIAGRWQDHLLFQVTFPD